MKPEIKGIEGECQYHNDGKRNLGSLEYWENLRNWANREFGIGGGGCHGKFRKRVGD
jgi:hypothetical protein